MAHEAERAVGNKCQARAPARRRAFSLVELILVLAIVAVLAAIAVPRYAAATERYRSEATVRRIAGDLAAARATARTSSFCQTATFSVETNSYQVSGLAGLDDSSAAYVVDLAASPYQARLVSADFGGDCEVTFDGWGDPDSGGSVVVATGDVERTVLLNWPTGEATIQ